MYHFMAFSRIQLDNWNWEIEDTVQTLKKIPIIFYIILNIIHKPSHPGLGVGGGVQNQQISLCPTLA